MVVKSYRHGRGVNNVNHPVFVLAAVVTEVMSKRGWKEQKDAAEGLNVPESSISNWLKGRIPNDSNLRMLHEIVPFDMNLAITVREFKRLRNALRRRNIKMEHYLY